MCTGAGDIETFLVEEVDVVLVQVRSVRGSAPREAGAWMLVSHARSCATIGGGRLELLAIAHARQMLGSDSVASELDVPLGPEIGQCCGGRVVLGFERLDRAAAAALVDRSDLDHACRPLVYVFGAGHVGKALVSALALAPLRVILVDTRADELSAVRIPGVEKRLSPMPEAEVRAAPPGSAFVVLTHDHGLDFLITSEALGRGDAAYVGLIGSRTKNVTFRNWLVRESGHRAKIEGLTCPIGGSGVKDKRPAVIATLVAAEVLTHVLNHIPNQTEPAMSSRASKASRRAFQQSGAGISPP